MFLSLVITLDCFKVYSSLFIDLKKGRTYTPLFKLGFVRKSKPKKGALTYHLFFKRVFVRERKRAHLYTTFLKWNRANFFGVKNAAHFKNSLRSCSKKKFKNKKLKEKLQADFQF